jgi:cytochrome c biogenesis factor
MSILVKLLFGLKPRGTVASRIAHLGLLLLVISVGFSWNEQSVQAQLTKGEKIMLGGYEFVYDSFEHKVAGEVTLVGPQIVVKKNGLQKRLWPHSSIYPGIRDEAKSTSEVAVYTGFIEDVYVSFDGVSPDGGVVITAKIKPFMLWLWAAGALVIFGIALAAFGGKRARFRSLISEPDSRPLTPDP